MRSSVVWVLVLYGSSVILLYAFKCCGGCVRSCVFSFVFFIVLWCCMGSSDVILYRF